MLVVLLGTLSALLQNSAAAWQVAGANGGNQFASGSWGTPDAPPALAATPTDGQVALSWTAPPGNGSTVSGYTATSTPGGATCTVTAPTTACTVTGLTDGITYTFSVLAHSNNGDGPGAAVTATPYPSTVMSPARLSLWLDGADASTLFASSSCTGAAATTSVGCFADKSSQGNHLSQAAGGSRPGTATVAGHAVPSFNGSQYLAGNPSLLPTGTTDGTVVMAGAVNPAVAMNGIAALSYGGTTNGSQRRITSWVQAGVDVAGAPMAFASPWPGSQAQGVVAASFTTGSTVSTWANGDTGASASGAFSTGSNHLWLGAGGLAAPSGGWDGTIAEVLAFTGAVSPAERRVLEEYLARKWGGVITPQAPTGVAATTADAATSISWTAPPWNGGSAVTSYTATLVPSDGSATLTCTAAASPCAAGGLTNGVTYTVTVAATNTAGTGPSSASVSSTPYPASLFAPADLKVWLDAQDSASLSAATDCSGSGVGTGSGVGCWKDRSGNGWDAPRGGSTSAVLTASAINGRAALRFVKTDPDYYEITAAGIGAVGSTDRTVLAVVTPRTTYGTAGDQSASFVAGWSLGYSGGIMAHANSGTTTTIDEIQADGYAADTTGIYAGVASSGTVVASAVFSSSGGTLTSAFAANGRGALVSSSSAAGSWYAYGDEFRVGTAGVPASGSYSYPLDGDIGEVLVFDRVLTAAERRTAEEYLARHWAQSIAPSAVAAPTVTTPAGGSLKATWVAPAWNGGSAVTAYTATASPGGLTCTATAPTLNCTIGGLTPGATYSLTVTATNAVGTGPAGAGASGTA